MEWLASALLTRLMEVAVAKLFDCLVEWLKDRREKARRKGPDAPKHLKRP